MKKNRLKKKRADLAYRAKEAAEQKKRRKNIEYQETEKARLSTLRSSKKFRSEEALSQKKRRENVEYQEAEKERLIKLRISTNFRRNEAQTQKRRRQTKSYKLSEKLRNKRRQSNQSFAQRLRHLDSVFRSAEQSKDRRRKIIKRYDRFNRLRQNRINRKRMRRLRASDIYRRSLKKAALTAKSTKKIVKKSLNEILKQREKFRRNLYAKAQLNQPEARNIIRFLEDRYETPKYICVCCEGLFFYHSVKTATDEEITELAPPRSKFSTVYICTTCRQQFKKGKLPTLAVKIGLEFPDLPKCITDLTPLEERLVSPYINFMQLRDLTPHALNPQIGIKGSVVNIPVSVPEMINVLPRAFNNVQTVQLKLKRLLEHKSDYMFETVNLKAIHDALTILIPGPLYRKNNIIADKAFMLQNENNT